MSSENETQIPSNRPIEDPLVDIQYIARLAGVSVVTVYKWKKQPWFPPWIVFNRRLHRWRLSTVTKFIAELEQRSLPAAATLTSPPWDTK